ncbi:MAG: cell wall-binding protein, partial [Blautia obeum]|nr:cell wall-binding protein [Blautia obeum]
MSDKKRHLNPLLLLIAILLCLSAGFLFRRTSFDANYKIPARHSSVIKKSKVTPTPVPTQKPKANVSISATPTI